MSKGNFRGFTGAGIIVSCMTMVITTVSCHTGKQETGDQMPPLNPSPLTIPLNTGGGFAIHPLTGDSVQPIIDNRGDTLKTGEPFLVEGFLTGSDIPETPVPLRAKSPAEFRPDKKVYMIPEKLTMIPLNRDALRSYIPGKDIRDDSFILINSSGDTIKTAVPAAVRGTVVPCRMPVPVKALKPRLKENWIECIKYLDVEQGMNSSLVSAILEDSRGDLWIGTSGGGVSKFNGESFVHFTVKEGLSSNDINSIIEDRHGNLWFGTQLGGVTMYDGERFTHFTEKEGLSSNFVNALLEDRQGNIWFGTWGGGLIRYDGNTLTHYTTRDGLGSNAIHTLALDSMGNILIGHIGRATLYDGISFTQFTHDAGFIRSNVWSILVDSRGNIWYGTNDALLRFDGKYFTYFTESEGMSDQFVLSMLEDRQGDLWFGTNEGGICRFDGKSFTQIVDIKGYSGATSLWEDSYGNILFCSAGRGLNIYNPGSFKHYSEKDGLIHNNVHFILEDRNKNLWFGTWGAGMTMYDGKIFRQYAWEQGLGTVFVTSMLEDRRGNLWFGTDCGGLVRYNGQTFSRFTDNGFFQGEVVYSFCEDSQGRLWLGTWKSGLVMFDGKVFTHFTETDKFAGKYSVRSIIEDSHGDIWFSTLGSGVCRYSDRGFTCYTEREGLSDNFVWTILEDSHGNLWFGTETGGANLFDGRSFTFFTEKEGLIDNSVRSIAEDGNGNIWLGTMKGLNCLVFGPDSLSGRGSRNDPVIYSFNEQEGLQGLDFRNNCVKLDSRDRLWWGTGRGLTMLEMDQFRLPADPPANLNITYLEINGQFLDFRNLPDSIAAKITFDSVNRFNNFPVGLKLAFRQDHLTFHFAATDWAAPDKILYSYKMEGLDRRWSTPSPDPVADYRNLPFKTLNFKVRAIGAAQKWSEPFSYNFAIEPPWWIRWWAIVLYCLGFLLVLRYYIKFIISRERMRAEVKIKQLEVEKMQDLDRMKSRFFANISHEFRTPLTLILGPIEGLMKNKDKEAVLKRDELGILHRNAKRLLQLINQILDISRLETGRIKLQVTEGDFTRYLRTLVLSFLSLAESRNIRYTYDLPETPGHVLFDRDKLEKIITNLLSNAFKFTPEGGVVSVSLEYKVPDGKDAAGLAEITVRDTGRGIPADQLDRIFDRFYQVSSSDTREYEGSGIGLSLTKELVTLYRGDIRVESKPNKGSIFTVVLPLSRELFRPGEIIEEEAHEQVVPAYQPADIPEGSRGETGIHRDSPEDEDTARPVLLIVEDNADLRAYISGNLADRFRILEAENGRNGLNVAIEEIPDLVITDLMMPGMDGVELCRQIRNDHRTNHIPVIMLTAKADRDSKMAGLENGADDYIIKPFNVEELLVRVKNLIEQRRKLKERYRREFLMDPVANGIPAPGDEFLVRLNKCTNKHLDDTEFSVRQLGEELQLSHTQLYRKVLSLTGFTPNEYIRNYRLKMAARMLAEGQTNITTVLYSVGYNSPSYFARSFKELFGVNPSEFIRNKTGNRMAEGSE